MNCRIDDSKGKLATDSNYYVLSGSDWTIQAGDPGAQSFPGTVPGNIQADLERAHALKPLWYGAGDDRLYDVPEKSWTYRKVFMAPESQTGRRVRLVFDGVDTPGYFIDGMNHLRQQTQRLKSPTNWGWDWGVSVYTLGIWKDVRLEESGPARIEWMPELNLERLFPDLHRRFKCVFRRDHLEVFRQPVGGGFLG